MPVFLLSPKVVVSEAKKASEAKKGGGEEEQEEEYAYVRLKPVKASKSVFLLRENFTRCPSTKWSNYPFLLVGLILGR